MSELWLCRARLRRDVAVATLAPLILPLDENARVASEHRLIWSLFAGEGPNAKRDFLWREASNGYFYTLSSRPPSQNHALFVIDAPKLFAPALSAGDHLHFTLRANPTVARPTNEYRSTNRQVGAKLSRKTAHDDVVMHALHGLPAGARAHARVAAIETAGRKWLGAQGARCGFSLASPRDSVDGDASRSALRIDGYRVLRPPRPSKGPQMRIAILEFEGVLTVTDPNVFIAALGRGFGRAKAYGCGLMLIARI
jgi:CRISPR system Cascade subunit CasE